MNKFLSLLGLRWVGCLWPLASTSLDPGQQSRQSSACARAAGLAAVLHLTGLGWPNRLGPVIQNPRVQVQGECSLSQGGGEASVPLGLRPGVTWQSTHTRCWACCPGTSLNPKGQALDCPPPQTSPGLLPSPRAQRSHRICLLRLSILQKAETNEPWDEQGMQKRHTQGEHRRSEL